VVKITKTNSNSSTVLQESIREVKCQFIEHILKRSLISSIRVADHNKLKNPIHQKRHKLIS